MDESRISRSTGVAMIVFAFLIDTTQFLLTFIPFVGWVLSPLVGFVAAMIFGIWCSHLNVSLLSSKRSLGFLSTLLGEAIPFVDGMWWWTIFISYTVITEWRRKTDI